MNCFLLQSTKTICCFKPRIHSLHLSTIDVNEHSCLCMFGGKVSQWQGNISTANGIFETLLSMPVSNKPNWDNKSWQQITFNANFNVTARWKLWVSFVKFKLQVKFALVNSARESLCLENRVKKFKVRLKRATNPWNEVEWELFQYLNIHTLNFIIYKLWRVAIRQRFAWSEICSSNYSTSLRCEMFSSGMLFLEKKENRTDSHGII